VDASRYGVDISEEMANLSACLAGRSIRFRAEVRVGAMLRLAYDGLWRLSRRMVDRSALLGSLATALLGRRAIRGEDAGFRNILEATRYLDAIVAKDGRWKGRRLR